MKFIRPKIIGTMKVEKMMAGNWAVINDIKNSTNRICIPCKSKKEGEEIIDRIKSARVGDELFFASLN